MSSGPARRWRPTDDEVPGLVNAIAGVASAILPGFAPFAMPTAALVGFFYRRRDLMFQRVGGVVEPRQAWDVWGRSVNATGVSRGDLEYDLLGLLDWRVRNEQRITVTPRLTRAALAAGLRRGDPVPVALMSRSWSRSESNLIIPARVGSSVTVAVPRGDYRVVALGSRASALFQRHDPVVAAGGGGVHRERRTELEIPLLGLDAPTRARRQVAPAYRASVPQRPPQAGRCLYCGAQVGRDPIAHLVTCARRPAALRQLTRFPAPAATARRSRLRLGLCVYCGQDFGSSLAQHAPSCPRRPKVCAVCHATFTSDRGLSQHMRARHPSLADLMPIRARSGTRQGVRRR